MAKLEKPPLLNADILNPISILNILLITLISINISLKYASNYMWFVLPLIPLSLYMALFSLNKVLIRPAGIKRHICIHAELALLYLLALTLLYLSSKYKVVLLLPVFFYSIQFGRTWGYGASLLNLVVLAAFFLIREERTVYGLEANLFLAAIFFLVGRLAGKGDFLEKLKRWSYSLYSAAMGTGWRDELTGLYNKRFLEKELKELLQSSKNNLKIALILLQLHRQEEFRTNWGLCAESILLKNLVKTLRDLLEKKEVAAHLGEGIFAVITQVRDLAAIVSKGERIRKVLHHNLERGLEDEWNLPVAVGIAIYPDHASSAAGLVQKAETALARSLVTRGSRIQVYYSILDRISSTPQHRHLIQSLKRIISPMQSLDRVGYGHSERVLIYTQLICRGLGLTKRKGQAIQYAAFLHDVGKMELQRNIPLMPQSRKWLDLKVYRQHPLRGAELLRRQQKHLHTVVAAVLHHHEKYDGSGYPANLKGNAIPLGARIIAVADFFDWLTVERPHGRGKTMEQGINALLQDKGTYFDPLVVETFVRGLSGYEDMAQIFEWPKDLSKIVPCGYTAHHYLRGGHYAEYCYGEVHFLVKAVYCLAAAVANGEKCLYIIDNQKEQMLLQQINKFTLKDVKISEYIRPGQLEKVLFPKDLWETDPQSAKFELEIRRLVKGWLERCEIEKYNSAKA